MKPSLDLKRNYSFIIFICVFIIATQGFAQKSLLSGTSVNFHGASGDSNMSYSQPLIDFGKSFRIKDAVSYDAKIKLLKKGDSHSLQIELGHKEDRPSVTLPFPKDIDLSEYIAIAMDITNQGQKQIAIEAQCFSETDKSLRIEDGAAFYYRGMLVLNPGETDTLLILLSRSIDSLPEHIRMQSRLSGQGLQTMESKVDNEAFNETEIEFPLIVNRQSETEFYKVVACETDEGINIFFVNKSTEPVKLQQQLPKGYYVESIEELYAPDRLSRTYMDHSDLQLSKRQLKNSRTIDICPLSVSRIKAKKQI